MSSKLLSSSQFALEPLVPACAGDFPDPFLLRHDVNGGGYVAYATGGVGEDGRAFRTRTSRDLHHWASTGGALVPPPGTEAQSFWAPEVARGDDGRFYMYYSVGRESEQRHVLRVATCDTPFGPFRDTDTPLIDPAQQRFVIDPHPFRDEDGSWWLFYARDYLDGPRPGTALAVDRLLDMTRLAGEERPVLRATEDWTLFEPDRSMPAYGGRFDWHTLEGPNVLRHEGRYYLFYSGARYDSERYGVDWAEADHVAGPYRHVPILDSEFGAGNGPRFLRTIPDVLRGPGHHSVSVAPDGTPIVAFHAWDSTRSCRQMHLAALRWDDGRPSVEIETTTK